MEQDFKAGDVVQLKSGGPKMTVEKVANYSLGDKPELKAACVWFEGTKKHEAVLSLAVLASV
jgi:uncharacterized protein YodC (DUF2158 family)